MFHSRYLQAFAVAFLALTSSPLLAAVTTTGDVLPVDPTSWDDKTTSYIGKTKTGGMTINGGSITDGVGFIGHSPIATGTVTVDGANSLWTNTRELFVACSGRGTLNIINGGHVASRDTYITYYQNSAGTINFGANGGVLTTNSLFFPTPDRLTGTGTINTNGIVTDLDFVFDPAHSPNRTFVFSGPEKDVTLNLNQNSTGRLGVGYRGSASMAIQGGVTVDSGTGYLGFHDGSSGIATISGKNSTWNNGGLYVGRSGNGRLHIIDGGKVRSDGCYIAYGDHTSGEVMVDGADSIWNNSYNGAGYIYVGHGYSSHGTLRISNGGTVNNYEFSMVAYGMYSSANVTVDGANSTWNNQTKLHVGVSGNATLNITNGARVTFGEASIGHFDGSVAVVTVDGPGSTLTSRGNLGIHRSGDLCVGGNLYGYDSFGSGTLTITNQGLVRVDGKLAIDVNEDGESFINMSTGGMLALLGDLDDSLTTFLDQVRGTDAIRYWDDSIGTTGDWTSLASGTSGIDYTLQYQTAGPHSGYTVLTVGTPIPEPSTVVLLLLLTVWIVPRLRHRHASH